MEVKRGDVIVQGRQFDDGTPRPRSLLDEEQTAVETRRLGGGGGAGSTAPFWRIS